MFENVLSTMIFLPIVVGLAAMLIPFSSTTARRIGLLASLVVLYFGIRVYLDSPAAANSSSPKRERCLNPSGSPTGSVSMASAYLSC